MERKLRRLCPWAIWRCFHRGNFEYGLGTIDWIVVAIDRHMVRCIREHCCYAWQRGGWSRAAPRRARPRGLGSIRASVVIGRLLREIFLPASALGDLCRLVSLDKREDGIFLRDDRLPRPGTQRRRRVVVQGRCGGKVMVLAIDLACAI